MYNVLSTATDLTHTIVKTFQDLVVCASCSFTAGSEAEGCAVELESEAHTPLQHVPQYWWRGRAVRVSTGLLHSGRGGRIQCACV